MAKRNNYAERTILHYLTLTPDSTAWEIVDATGISKASVHRIISSNPTIEVNGHRPPRYRVNLAAVEATVNRANGKRASSDSVTEIEKWRAEHDKQLADSEASIPEFVAMLTQAMPGSAKAMLVHQAALNAAEFSRGLGPIDPELQTKARENVAALRKTLYNFYRFLENLDTDPRIDTPENWTVYVSESE